MDFVRAHSPAAGHESCSLKRPSESNTMGSQQSIMLADTNYSSRKISTRLDQSRNQANRVRMV